MLRNSYLVLKKERSAMKKQFASLALKAVHHPVQLFPPNDRSYDKFGDSVVARCIEIIETSENLNEARARIKEEFEQKT
jgi:hypothetical protein